MRARLAPLSAESSQGVARLACSCISGVKTRPLDPAPRRRLFASGDATGDTPHSRENGHRAGSNRRSIALRPSGYPRRNYTIACGERELLIAPKVGAHIGLADRRHCEANTLPLSYTPESTLSRHLETQGFEPWTFCNVVCAAAATPAGRDAPEVGLEPTTTRLRVLRSAD